MAEVQEETRQQARSFPTFNVTIELGDDKGRNPQFPPLGQPYIRGRWDSRQMVNQTGHPALGKLPDIPGIYLQLNTGQRAGRMYDPLETEAHKETLEKLYGPYKSLTGLDGKPWAEIVKKGMSDTDMKTWLYWMMRLVDAGKARIVEGRLPESFEHHAKLPGKTLISQFNRSSRAIKTREAQEEYLDKLGFTQ